MEDEPTVPNPPVGSTGGEETTTPGATVPPPAPAPPLSPQPHGAKPNPIAKIVGHRATGWFVAALLVGVVTGLAVALANAPSTPVSSVTYRSPVAVRPPNAYQVPVQVPSALPVPFRQIGNITAGRVSSVSASSFTIASLSGSVVTVDEQSSTTYRGVGGPATKASVKKGDEVLVIGSRSGSTVKASEVIVGAIRPRTFFLPG